MTGFMHLSSKESFKLQNPISLTIRRSDEIVKHSLAAKFHPARHDQQISVLHKVENRSSFDSNK